MTDQEKHSFDVADDNKSHIDHIAVAAAEAAANGSESEPSKRDDPVVTDASTCDVESVVSRTAVECPIDQSSLLSSSSSLALSTDSSAASTASDTSQPAISETTSLSSSSSSSSDKPSQDTLVSPTPTAHSPQAPVPKRLHVSNIPFRFRDADLKAMFGVSSFCPTSLFHLRVYN